MNKKILALSILSLPFLSISHVYAAKKAIVLMYHSIGDKNNSMNVKETCFSEQMDYLHKNGFNVISSLDLVKAIKDKTEVPDKSVIITFDDGWSSQKIAMNKLAEYNYPATFALVTQYQKMKTNAYIQKKDIEQYKDQNFLYVNHSRTHFKKDYLGNPSYDVAKSKQDLIDVTNSFIPIYVYPYGAKNSKLLKVIKDDGYIAGFGVYSHPVYIDTANIFNINRYLINHTITMDAFKDIVNIVN